ncbi:hypothetical protein ACFE04_005525 [Oxalis oulophora]
MNLDTSITEPVFTNSIREEDRFSILSKDVLHHLLSFLTIEDLAKLSFVSKKYENLCLFVPSLTIDCDDITSVQRTQLMDFIVSFIKNRKGTQTTRLAIYWCDDKLTFNQTFRVLSWLNHAIACHPNEIVIAIDFESNTFMIPVEVFWYISLRHHLEVDCLGVFPEYFSMEIIKTEVKYFVSLRCNDTCSSAIDELQRLLYNIAPVTKLVIDSSAIQLLYKNKYLPCAFRDLESVVLSYNIFTNITSPATVLFLQMLPRNLKKLHMDCVASAKGGDLRSKRNMVELELKPREQDWFYMCLCFVALIWPLEIMFYNKVYGNLSLMLVVVIIGSEHRLFDF